jgi:hypothetical protein
MWQKICANLPIEFENLKMCKFKNDYFASQSVKLFEPLRLP